MAKSSSFFGLRTGSTKSLTFQVLRGQQITKDRVTKVSNPQSEAQMRQRALIPMVAAARSELSGIVNHSWEGITYGESSLRYFSKVNLTAGTLDVSSYACKNISNPGIANFIVSKGSISIPYDFLSEPDGLAYSFHINGDDATKSFPKLDAGTKGSTVVYYVAKRLADLHIDKFSKMQFTFLNMLLTDRVPVSIGVATGEQAEVLQSGFSVQRVVLPDPSSITEAAVVDYHDDNDIWTLKTAVAEGGSNTVALSDEAGNMLSILIDGRNLGFTLLPVGSYVGSCMLLSQLDGSIWRRSNARLTIFSEKVTPKFTFDTWFKFYDKAQVMRSDKYLNNGSTLPSVNG